MLQSSEAYFRQTNKNDIQDLDWIIWKDDSGRTDMESIIKGIVPNPSIVLRTNSYAEMCEYIAEGLQLYIRTFQRMN